MGRTIPASPTTTSRPRRFGRQSAPPLKRVLNGFLLLKVDHSTSLPCEMPDTINNPFYALALRQAEEARADFYAIQDDLDCIKRQLARQPNRAWLARMGLIGFGSLWALL